MVFIIIDLRYLRNHYVAIRKIVNYDISVYIIETSSILVLIWMNEGGGGALIGRLHDRKKLQLRRPYIRRMLPYNCGTSPVDLRTHSGRRCTVILVGSSDFSWCSSKFVEKLSLSITEYVVDTLSFRFEKVPKLRHWLSLDDMPTNRASSILTSKSLTRLGSKRWFESELRYARSWFLVDVVEDLLLKTPWVWFLTLGV